MQIMPTLAYLTPITLLFLIGVAPSTVATLIFAVPAAIRITALGIRGVSATTVEAARSLGATERQVLTKVLLPLARRPIGLAINQTIMLALSMVVITALIGAPGLGRNLQVALSKVDVGAAFDAGIAIVILAIVLDRLTFAAGEWLDPRERAAHPRRGGRWARSARRSLILRCRARGAAVRGRDDVPGGDHVLVPRARERDRRLVHARPSTRSRSASRTS